MRPGLVAIAAFAAICATVSLHAQSFDNFGGNGLEGFDFGEQAPDGDRVPSLTDPDGLGIGPDIELDEGTGSGDIGLITVPGTDRPVTSVTQPETDASDVVILRALDKLLGRPNDIELARGETVLFGRIAIRLLDCRFPVDDPTSDAFAHLEVYDIEGNPLFDGWMIASSPALNALEHPRYDVWVLRCGGLAE